MSRLIPSGPWQTTASRPPSAARDSCHHTPAASMAGNDNATCSRATSALWMGEVHSPKGATSVVLCIPNIMPDNSHVITRPCRVRMAPILVVWQQAAGPTRFAPTGAR